MIGLTETLSLGSAGTRPVWLVVDDPVAVAEGGGTPWVTITMVALFVAVAMGVVLQILVRRMRTSSEDLAFAGLARRLRMRSSERGAVKRLAAASGTHACAIVVSEYAFESAKAGFSDGADEERLAKVRHRLFR